MVRSTTCLTLSPSGWGKESGYICLIHFLHRCLTYFRKKEMEEQDELYASEENWANGDGVGKGRTIAGEKLS